MRRMARTLIASCLLILPGAGGSAAQNPPLLSSEDKAELSEALRLQKTLGAQVWPGFEKSGIPIVLYDETSEFLIGLPDPPASWAAVEGDDFEGRPYFRRPASKPQSFAVRLDGRWAGSIGNLGHMNSKSPFKLSRGFHVAALLHEIFHAFQAEKAPERFDRALKVYAAETRYPFDDPEFAAAWDREGSFLAAGLKAPDEAGARAAAREFLASRDSRRASLAPDLLAFERELEWLEGLGKYAEGRFAELAASGPGKPPPSTLTPSAPFKLWDAALLEKRLGGQKGDLRFYLSGSAQARLLDRLSPDWKAKTQLAEVVLEEALHDALEPRGGRGLAKRESTIHRGK